MKQCASCKIFKHISAFSVYSSGNPKKRCKPCQNIIEQKRRHKRLATEPGHAAVLRKRANKWSAKNRKKLQGYKLKYKFGITASQRNKMIHEQNGLCAICDEDLSTSFRVSVDHNHKTGKVRGILCNNCNLGLGIFRDSIELIQKAQTYLEKHK